MKRFRRRVIPFRNAWHALACGVLLLFALGLHAQQAPVIATQQSEIGANSESVASLLGEKQIYVAPQSQTQLPDDRQPVITPTELTLNTRFKLYTHGITSPKSLIGPAVGAGLGQWSNSPEQWGQGMAGYGRRFGSGYARFLISSTIGFGVAAVDHEDPRFMPSNQSGVVKRAAHTVAATFVTHTDRGNLIPAYSRFIGHYSASFIANSWYPEPKRTFGGAMKRGTYAVLSSVVWRLLEEFGPDLWGRLHHRKD